MHQVLFMVDLHLYHYEIIIQQYVCIYINHTTMMHQVLFMVDQPGNALRNIFLICCPLVVSVDRYCLYYCHYYWQRS
jgi:hypothetical protein